MLHLLRGYQEYSLADAARAYIPLYAKGAICYIPYFDVQAQEKKFIKFVYEDATGWMYVDTTV